MQTRAYDDAMIKAVGVSVIQDDALYEERKVNDKPARLQIECGATASLADGISIQIATLD